MKNDCWCYHSVTRNEQKLYEGGLAAILRTKFKPGIASVPGMPCPWQSLQKKKSSIFPDSFRIL